MYNGVQLQVQRCRIVMEHIDVRPAPLQMSQQNIRHTFPAVLFNQNKERQKRDQQSEIVRIKSSETVTYAKDHFHIVRIGVGQLVYDRDRAVRSL